jgi:mono/diheme cytochrome c family protein
MKLLPVMAIAAIGVGVSTHPIACYPRMRETPSVLPYERRAPDMPKGLEPFAAENVYPPALQPPEPTANPVPRTAASVRLGRIYYGYYCEQCHAAGGTGAGPVGRSYVPVAPALNTPAVRGLTDYRLTQAMVTGTGHAPVLETTVPPDRRWYIVNYLRSLAPAPAAPASGP